MGRTDRQTDGRGATLSAAPWEGLCYKELQKYISCVERSCIYICQTKEDQQSPKLWMRDNVT